ncbi:MAG: hypothetical protein WC549_00600 [Actinomycetota bacterium]
MGSLYGKKGINSEAYLRYVICKEFGWDYFTYMSQPAFFIEEILLIMNQIAQKEEKENKKLERQASRIKHK